MAVDVLIAKTTDIVYLRHGRRTILVLATIPGILVDLVIVHKRVRYLVVYFIRSIITDRILHAVARRTARYAVVCMLTASALFLAVTTPITGIKQVRDTRVHQCVYLLHTTLLAIIMEVDPVHAGRRGITRYA